jgi:hypothetical protein|tara:strand:- start:22502 stop:22693 length:192 start_codon:yes stop_codon:yes gene_type:complete
MATKSNLHHTRIKHINALMEGIHTSNNEIYECLVDREHEKAKVEIKSLIKNLQGVLDSLQDEL